MPLYGNDNSNTRAIATASVEEANVRRLATAREQRAISLSDTTTAATTTITTTTGTATMATTQPVLEQVLVLELVR